MSEAHESQNWCYRCDKHVAVLTLDDDVVLCCECNEGFVSTIQEDEVPAAHSTETEVVSYGTGGRAGSIFDFFTSIPRMLERQAPPAAKSAVEALETFEVSSTCVEDGERMSLDCAVCKDTMVIGETWKKLPCGHCYHGNCILPWLETKNSCPVCRFRLRTDNAAYEFYRSITEAPRVNVFASASSSSMGGREEPPMNVSAGASSSSMGGREENNDHHVVEPSRRSKRKRKPNRLIID